MVLVEILSLTLEINLLYFRKLELCLIIASIPVLLSSFVYQKSYQIAYTQPRSCTKMCLRLIPIRWLLFVLEVALLQIDTHIPNSTESPQVCRPETVANK